MVTVRRGVRKGWRRGSPGWAHHAGCRRTRGRKPSSQARPALAADAPPPSGFGGNAPLTTQRRPRTSGSRIAAGSAQAEVSGRAAGLRALPGAGEAAGPAGLCGARLGACPARRGAGRPSRALSGAWPGPREAGLEPTGIPPARLCPGSGCTPLGAVRVRRKLVGRPGSVRGGRCREDAEGPAGEFCAQRGWNSVPGRGNSRR